MNIFDWTYERIRHTFLHIYVIWMNIFDWAYERIIHAFCIFMLYEWIYSIGYMKGLAIHFAYLCYMNEYIRMDIWKDETYILHIYVIWMNRCDWTYERIRHTFLHIYVIWMNRCDWTYERIRHTFCIFMLYEWIYSIGHMKGLDIHFCIFMLYEWTYSIGYMKGLDIHFAYLCYMNEYIRLDIWTD